MVWRKILILRVVPLLLLATVTGMLYAAEGDTYTLLDDSNLRQGPDSSYASTGVVREGEAAIELEAKGPWVKVRVPASGDVGWLYADSLERKLAARTADQLNNANKPAGQSTVAADVVVTSAINGVSTHAHADHKQQSKQLQQPAQVHLVAPLFEDGAVSHQTAAVEEQQQPVETTQSAVTATDVLGQQTVSNIEAEHAGKHPETVVTGQVEEPAAVAAVAPSKVALQPQAPADISKPLVSDATSASAEKAAVNGKQQQIVQAGGLDQEATTDALNTPGQAEPVRPLAQDGTVAPLFENGAVPHQTAPVEEQQPVETTQSAVTATDVLDQQTVSNIEAEHAAKHPETVATGQVEEPAAVATVVPSEVTHHAQQTISTSNQTMSNAKSISAEKTAVNSKQQHVVEAVGDMQQVLETSTIRTGPGASSDILGWVGKGARVRAVERQGDWLKVSIPDGGRAGWMEAGALQPVEMRHVDKATITATTALPQGVNKMSVTEKNQLSVASIPPANSVQTAARAKPSGESVVGFVKTANLRAGPASHFDVVAWAGKGSYAKKLDHQGDWVRVQLQQSGRVGWVEKGLIKQMYMTGSLAVATPLSDQVTEAPVTPVAAMPTSGSRSAMTTVSQKGTDSIHQQRLATAQPTVKAIQAESAPVREVAPARIVEAGKPVSSPNGRSLFSFGRKANLRAGPDVKFNAVSWAGIGSYAYELDRKGDWVRVQMEVSKRIGWVYNRSLKLVKAGMRLPAVAVKSGQVAEQLVAQAPYVIAKATPDGLFMFKQTTNLRAGAGKQYDVVAWGGKHEAASILEKKGDWRKVRMSMSGKQGWVFHTTLISAGSGHAIAAAIVPEHKPDVEMYQVLRTEPLRTDAMKFSELSGWVGKGESVALLEQRDGWMRVQPQDAVKQPGWIEADYLRPTSEIQVNSKPKKELRTVAYQDRISKGEAFNFSYAALESALYRVPVEDISVRIGRDDMKALFRKGIYDKSSFEIRLRSGRHHLAGRITVLGSSTRIFKKKSLLIKLDKESSHWYGRRRIALRSMASDKALMREWMAWKLLAALGMKVPEVHFTRVSFNHGEKTGLYLNIEWMGKQFLQENNLDVNGGFYQPNDASHCGDLNSSENMEMCFDKITPQDDDYSMLTTMAKVVSTASPADMDQVLAKYFNDESVINWIAVNALVTNGDTYNKNYWLHYSPTNQKWTLVPWDYNLTFGRVYDPFGVKPFKIFNDNFQYYFPIDVAASNPLKDKLVRNPQLRARLETKLKHLLGLEPNGPEETFGWFSPTVMQARIGNLAAVVGKEVYKDTFLKYGEGDFTKTYESLMHYVTEHDYYLKAKLQGPYRWQPSPPFDPNLKPVANPLPKALYGEGAIDVGGQSVHMTDQGWGYFVARLALDEPAKKKTNFKVRVEGGKVPAYLPIGQSPGRCIRRSWVVSTPTPGVSANGNLMVEYLQENSKRTEVPETLHEELLELWVRDGSHWRPLKTEVNEYANTLIARGVHVESGHIQRFVACSPF